MFSEILECFSAFSEAIFKAALAKKSDVMVRAFDPVAHALTILERNLLKNAFG